MSKLYFSYSAMNAGKSTALLQVAHNYEERGMNVYLLSAKLDTRSGEGFIASRVGLKHECDTFSETCDLFKKIEDKHLGTPLSCVLIDEAHWLSPEHVNQLAKTADTLGVPIMCYGLRTDFKGNLFPGSERLLALADDLREIRTICHCGKKATMVLRLDAEGNVLLDGPQTKVGGNESYVSVCRKHWSEALTN
ncbi:MAG: thymidine kinase [Patescibacteria group bacterium UBA2103]